MELRRQAARVVVIDDAGRVLLQQARDPFHASKPPWWELPGGGIDRGESSADAAARELFEETGVRDVELGPVVWRQRSKFTFAGWHFDQDEHIHVAWLRGPAPEWRPAHLELLERHAFLGIRWWDVDDLLANDEPTVPPRLREFLPALARGDVPESPLDIGVPIG